jgi:anti-anti-sigma regulatory factor
MNKSLIEGAGCSLNTIEKKLILSIPCEISDHGINQMFSMVLERAHQKTIRGVILDFAIVEMIDTFMYEKFLMLTQALYLMGIDVYWVELKPPIVATLMDKQISLEKSNIKTATNIEKAMLLLK